MFFAVSFATTAARAQLINGGFETAGTNYVFPNADNLGHIVTNVFASGWTPNGGAYVVRTSINSPQGDTYEDIDTGYDFVGLSNSASSVTAQTGTYALRAFGTFPTPPAAAGSGAYQLITSNAVPAVSNNTIWVMSGSLLNWSGDPLADIGIGSVSFGLIQIVFLDGNGTNLLTIDGPHKDTNTVQNTWISCSVTGTAPAGTAQIQFFALHVGNSGGVGSIFFDDLSSTNIGVAPPPPPIITNFFNTAIQAGNQVCWSTTTNVSYQPQFSDDNVTWNSIGSLLPGDGTSNCVFAITHKFYRVVQSQ